MKINARKYLSSVREDTHNIFTTLTLGQYPYILCDTWVEKMPIFGKLLLKNIVQKSAENSQVQSEVSQHLETEASYSWDGVGWGQGN